MRTTTVPFDLIAWAVRMGALAGKRTRKGLAKSLTQDEAASLLGLSQSGYKALERRNQERPGFPCNKTVAELARCRERDTANHACTTGDK